MSTDRQTIEAMLRDHGLDILDEWTEGDETVVAVDTDLNSPAGYYPAFRFDADGTLTGISVAIR